MLCGKGTRSVWIATFGMFLAFSCTFSVANATAQEHGGQERAALQEQLQELGHRRSSRSRDAYISSMTSS